MSIRLKMCVLMIVAVPVASLLAGCNCCEEKSCDPMCVPGTPGTDVTASGVFLQAVDTAHPSVSRFYLRGNHTWLSGAPKNAEVLGVYAFGSPGNVALGEEIEDPAKYFQYLLGSVGQPDPHWTLRVEDDRWSTQTRYSMLVRYVYREGDTVHCADQLGAFTSIVPQARIPFQLTTTTTERSPGDQASVQLCNGSFYNTGVALYDIEVQYSHRPRAIELYAAPPRTGPPPPPAFPDGPDDFVYRRFNLPNVDPATGLGTWVATDIQGAFNGTATYWFAIKVIYGGTSPPPPEVFTGTFANIVPIDEVPMGPLP